MLHKVAHVCVVIVDVLVWLDVMRLVVQRPRPVVAVPFAMLADLEPYPQDAAPNAVLPKNILR